MIWNAILKLTWFIFIQGPLGLIAAFTKVLEYLTGGIINDILFGSANDFQWDNIPFQFWWFVIIALCLFGLIFTIQMIILLFKEAIETKAKFVLAIQNGVKGFAFMFLIPIFFFLANFLVQNLANTVINNFGNGSNLAEYLYHIGDPTWDGNPIKGNGFPPPSNISDYNMIAQIFGTWFMLYAIFMIGIILVQKIVELFFLFIISPVVMIVMVVDNGKAAMTWKDMVGAKFLASTATLIGYYVFMSVTQLLLSSDLTSLKGVDWAKQLFILLFLCGGGLATMAFSDIVASFLNESAGIREGQASLKSTIAGGMMAMGAGRMVGKALGFMKSKRAKKNASMFNAGVDSNAFSNASNNGEKSSDEEGVNVSTFRNATNGMAARAGIIGLTGLAIGAAGAGIGHIVAGSQKAWRSGSRKGIWGKTKGVTRVIAKAATAPITAPAKMLKEGWKNTTLITKNSTKDAIANNFKNHNSSLRKTKEKYENKKQKLGLLFSTKNYSKKKRNRITQHQIKLNQKAKKSQAKYNRHYRENSKN